MTEECYTSLDYDEIYKQDEDEERLASGESKSSFSDGYHLDY